MVSASRTVGNPAAIDDGVRNTIRSLKEIAVNHSDADIYAALKEANMDANETAQKLLNQDPFREVKRKRDRKKELQVMTFPHSIDRRKQSDDAGQDMNSHAVSNRNVRRGGYSWNSVPRNPGSRNPAPRSSAHGTNREFRVVRDNRSKLNADGELKPTAPPSSLSNSEKVVSNVNEKSSTGTSSGIKPSGAQSAVHVLNGPADSMSRFTGHAPSSGSSRNFEEKQSVGVYSSSTDPVHVPSPDSRSSSTIGAIRREVRGVGSALQLSENAVKDVPAASGSLSNSLSRKVNSTYPPIPKADQLVQTNLPESVMPSASASKFFLNGQHGNRNHYGNRMQQQVGGHQKVLPQNKEWKPKSSQKSSVNSHAVIGTLDEAPSSPAGNGMEMESEAAKLQDQLSHVNISENQNVIIAEHIRVPETDRFRLTFGSFGPEFDSSHNSVSASEEVNMSKEANPGSTPCLPVSDPEASSDGAAAGNKPVEIVEDQVWHSVSASPASPASEQQSPEKNKVSRTQNLDDYADIGLLRGDSPSIAPSESQKHQDPPELQNFSAYDPQSGYDMMYFRPGIDETARGQGLLSSQEQALSSDIVNNIPASTLAMLQQQQAPMAQMYPQVQLSHFANLMPYRQFLSPVYFPQMPMPGYSGNPAAYPHPSNGNSYVVMPGGSSPHLGANGLKYGIQQFKPVPTGSLAGFGNFNNPTGYPMNSPGVVGNATGLEDTSRIKYKDGNIYVPNPQAETTELWTQNPRDLPGLQSTPYYSVAGQTPHGAYLPSHTGHASFNAAAAQTSHMQFQGLFHPPQPGAMPNPHHLGPAMGGNAGVGVAPPAPTAQAGTYQQPHLGQHMNWPTNF